MAVRFTLVLQENTILVIALKLWGSSYLDHLQAAPLLSLMWSKCSQSTQVFCQPLWNHSIRTSFPVEKKEMTVWKGVLALKMIHWKQECACVLTKAGTTSFTGLEEEYRCAFFAANFSVGIDFPAILSLRPSTCLQTTFHSYCLVITELTTKLCEQMMVLSNTPE